MGEFFYTIKLNGKVVATKVTFECVPIFMKAILTEYFAPNMSVTVERECRNFGEE